MEHDVSGLRPYCENCHSNHCHIELANDFFSRLAETSKMTSALASALSADKVLLPGTEAYLESNESYFAAFPAERNPSAIVRPACAADVSTALQALRPFVLHGTAQLAIRGGGYAQPAGSANVGDGVTIDMRGVRGMSLSADRSVISIAAGETWDAVYAHLEPLGLTVAGSRHGKVGVVGFLLGGGLSFYSGQTGFASDSVINYEVVLASGKVVNASATANADLWAALRGGLGTAGVVTRVDLPTVLPAAARMWGGMLGFEAGAFAPQARALCDFAAADRDPCAHVAVALGHGYGYTATTAMVYSTRGEENPAAVRAFTAVQPQIEAMRSIRFDSHRNYCMEQARFSEPGGRQFLTTTTIKPSLPLLLSAQEKFNAAVATLSDVQGLRLSLVLTPLTVSTLRQSARAAGGESGAHGLGPADGPLLLALINPAWSAREDDGRVAAAVTRLRDDIAAEAARSGLAHPFVFPGYAWSDQDVLAGYGEARAAQVKAAEAAWDPEGLFRAPGDGGLKMGFA